MAFSNEDLQQLNAYTKAYSFLRDRAKSLSPDSSGLKMTRQIGELVSFKYAEVPADQTIDAKTGDPSSDQ